ncbi:hypothetical protein L53_12980 [Hyphomonas sp. L-53-1-40]|uniref:hypothetical protein n=1 Tax=Hyphomonas sp. L-53-1-40 TaxID=1207058 RepID=UPI00045915F1|nr:hypothetical protein [Hyphomonas sp. L-53-1-40]KCZ62150.1 hypothetical protein L53_12980 [Hyphomonas sp. L-53-1-40]
MTQAEWMARLATFGPYIWEFALAVIFLMIGMVFSRREIGKREKKRVLEELTNIQREMYRRATKEWSETGYREVWMIGLYFERVVTLRNMLNDRDSLPIELNQMFESYESNLRNFGAVWASAQRRKDGFWQAYKSTFDSYHALIRKLSKEYVIANEPLIQLLQRKDMSHQPELT